MGKHDILFLHSSSDLYGSDRCLVNILSCLDRGKFEPHVILPDFGPLHQELKNLGIEPKVMNLGVLRKKFLSPRGIFLYLASLFFGSLRILLYIRGHRISIIHTNTSAVLAGGIAAKLSGIPHVWHLREIIAGPGWFLRLLSTFSFLSSDRLVAMSEAIRDHFLESSYCRRPEKICVVYEGVDTKRFSPVVSGNSFRKEIGLSRGEMLVGMVGRINRWKGQDYLVDVAEEVLRFYPKVLFLMVGDAYRGEEALVRRLKEQIESKGLNGKIVLQGFRKDSPSIYSAIDIYVHPSTLPEPFGLVVAEAMAMGKPVVANDLGGVREIIAHGQTGFLVDPKRRGQMVEAIKKLIEEKELREKMGRAGRRRILERFQTEAFKKKMDDLWNSFAGRGK